MDCHSEPSDETELDDLPPSAKLINKMLEYHGSLTAEEIEEESSLPRGTVSEALAQLDERVLISSQPSTDDARKTFYDL